MLSQYFESFDIFDKLFISLIYSIQIRKIWIVKNISNIVYYHFIFVER